jgi:succinate dehydrogenase / fumarate reductase flavoprotein subunit
MWEYVGMARSEEGLKKAIEEIRELKKEFYEDVCVPGEQNQFNQELEKALRLEDFFEIGELMARDALNRNESCGGHFRVESRLRKARPRGTMPITCMWLLGNTRVKERIPNCTRNP